MLRSICVLAMAGLLWPSVMLGETAEQAIVRATAAVEAATARAQADPAHPTFHVTSPAQWMNDPNGPIYYEGCYHLFYQLHPYSDRDGTKYWGHVRSRNLVKWERLPIALAPSNDKGEEAIWSGCCTINGLGQPMAFYTSIGLGKSAFDQATQWAAMGDDSLIHWHKLPDNPVLPESVNGATKIYDWRDPFIFHDGKETFLVTGGHLAKQGRAAVSIYEAENPALTQWKYRGTLFEHPDAETPTAECPNFFQLGKQWVLFVSPYGHVQYFIGDFDAKTCRFTAKTRGILDYGSFYAPNTMLVPDGRRLVWGWVNGFPDGHGWNGCLSLPRQLAVGRNGTLRQIPAPQLTKLRGKAVNWRGVHLQDNEQTFELPDTRALEMRADISLDAGASMAWKIESTASGEQPVEVGIDGTQLTVMDVKAPLPLSASDRRVNLRLFIDHSVLEVFANDTVCVTKVIPTLEPNASLVLRATGGGAEIGRLSVWPMKTIW